jgi:dTDP-glucose 4,6-dehydratase
VGEHPASADPCKVVAHQTGKPSPDLEKLIMFVKDRPGHDRRYAIDATKIRTELDWRPSVGFEQGLDITVRWYLDNSKWVDNVRSGAYQDWIARNYRDR